MLRNLLTTVPVVVLDYVRLPVRETVKVSVKEAAPETARQLARRSVPVRAGRRAREDVQADVQTDAAVLYVEEIASQVVKTNVYLTAPWPVAEDVPTNVQVPAPEDAITLAREPAKATVQ